MGMNLDFATNLHRLTYERSKRGAIKQMVCIMILSDRKQNIALLLSNAIHQKFIGQRVPWANYSMGASCSGGRSHTITFSLDFNASCLSWMRSSSQMGSPLSSLPVITGDASGASGTSATIMPSLDSAISRPLRR